MSAREVLVGVDVGGTFTDAVVVCGAQRHAAKATSTVPQDAGVIEAVERALDAAGLKARDVTRFAHGTTVATNALLERRGARVVSLITEGFEDLLELARQQRPDLHRLDRPPTTPPVTATIPVPERMGVDGVCVPLEPKTAERVAERVAALNVDAVAICLLHAWRDPTHEQLLAHAVRKRCPELQVVASSELGQEIREYERASTTVLDAYLTPVLEPYLRRLEHACAAAGLPAPLVMQSDGGLDELDAVASHAVRAVLSGPAGGIAAASGLLPAVGAAGFICVDTGGTSCDVAVVGGQGIERASLRTIDDLPIQLPTIDMHTVAAGGSSIAWRDSGGMVRLGPHSAGSEPGPASFGRGGTDATLTDAHLVLGNLQPTTLSRWGIELDPTRAAEALRRICAGGQSVEELAGEIVQLATTTMAEAARSVSVARGLDPGELVLLAYGGAGGLHACGIADEIGCGSVVVPLRAGVFSAEGLAGAPLRRSIARSILCPLDGHADFAAIGRDIEGLGAQLPASRMELALQVRYEGQGHSIDILEAEADARDLPQILARARAAFEAEHERRYGYRLAAPVQLVAARVSASVMTALPAESGSPDLSHMMRDGAIDLPHGTVLVPEGWEVLQCDGWLELRPRDRALVTGPQPLSVMHQRAAGIADEMGVVLVRAAISPNIKEREDSSCALFTADGELLAQAAHIPVHLGSMSTAVEAVLGRDPQPGSVWIVNDPYDGGTHLPDITLVSPLVDAVGRRVGVAAVRAHHADVGGETPGSMSATSRSIDEEGVRIAPQQIGTLEGFDTNILAEICGRMRQPQERSQDLHAQLAALRVAARRLPELVHRAGGSDGWARSCANLLDADARRARTALSPFAGATGSGERRIELPDERFATVRVQIRVERERIVVDLSASDDQTATSLNCPAAVTQAAVLFALRSVIDPDLRISGGLHRVVDVRTRPGSVVHAVHPAAVAGGNVEVSSVVVDAVFEALSAFTAVPADGQGTMNNLIVGGEHFSYYETIAGGQGAGATYDGSSAVHVAMTNTRNTPVEVLETEYPLEMVRYSRRRDSGGAGARRGGDGVIRAVRLREPATVSVITQRRIDPPRGRDGGSDGSPGSQLVDGAPRAGSFSEQLPAGAVVEIHTPGGGGHGT